MNKGILNTLRSCLVLLADKAATSLMHVWLSIHELLDSLGTLTLRDAGKIVIIIRSSNGYSLIRDVPGACVQSRSRSVLLPLLASCSRLKHSVRCFYCMSSCTGHCWLIVRFKVEASLSHNCGWRVVAASMFINRLGLGRSLNELEVQTLVLSTGWTNIEILFLLVTRVCIDAVPCLTQAVYNILRFSLLWHHHQTLI